MVFRCCIFVFFAFKSVSPSNFTFFSTINQLDNGFSVINISFNESSFELSQLIYNSSNKWKKIIYTGKKNRVKENLYLNPNKCKTYLKPFVDKKWILDRVFDCEHLNFILESKKKKRLKASIKSLSQPIFRTPVKIRKKSVIFIKQKKNFKLFWGNELHKLKTTQGILFDDNKKIGMGEVVGESFFITKDKKNIKIGSLFYIKGFSKTKATP